MTDTAEQLHASRQATAQALLELTTLPYVGGQKLVKFGMTTAKAVSLSHSQTLLAARNPLALPFLHIDWLQAMIKIQTILTPLHSAPS